MTVTADVINLRDGGDSALAVRPAGCVVMCAASVSSHTHVVRAIIRDGHAGAIIDEPEASGLPGVDRTFARLPAIAAEEPGAATWWSARRLADRLEGHAVVGLASFRNDSADIAEARTESALVLQVLMRHDDPTPEDVNSGTYRLMFRTMAADQRVLRDFCESTVGALIRYDERRHGQLMQTLRTYMFKSNCNVSATAAATFTHRHTVQYRLQRISDLTGLDPTQPADREQLGLGLKIRLILEATDSPDAPVDSRLSRQCRVAEQTDIRQTA